MSLNPLMQEIAELEIQLRDQEVRLRETETRRAQIASLPGMGSTLVQLDTAIATMRAAIERTKLLIEDKRKSAAQLDAAASEAVAQGLTPAAAYEKAIAEKERAKALKYLAIGVAALIVLMAVWYFIIRKK